MICNFSENSDNKIQKILVPDILDNNFTIKQYFEKCYVQLMCLRFYSPIYEYPSTIHARIPSSSLWCDPAISFFAERHLKLRNGDLLRDRDFTLPELDGVAGVELDPGAVRVSLDSTDRNVRYEDWWCKGLCRGNYLKDIGKYGAIKDWWNVNLWCNSINWYKILSELVMEMGIGEGEKQKNKKWKQHKTKLQRSKKHMQVKSCFFVKFIIFQLRVNYKNTDVKDYMHST